MNDTPHILNPELRWGVSAMVEAVVAADDMDHAMEQLQDGEWIEWVSPVWEAKPAVYDGTWLPERWRAACAACWFGWSDKTGTVRRLAAVVDGHDGWWATDGHIALRCDGAPPESAQTIRMSAAEWSRHIQGAAERRAVDEWLAVAGSNPVDLARAEPGGFDLDSKYMLLVEATGVDRWEVGDEPVVPAFAFRGEVVEAIVMGCAKHEDAELRSGEDVAVFSRRLDAVREAGRKMRVQQFPGGAS